MNAVALILVFAGLLIEMIGFTSVSSYSLRRWLPFKTPLTPITIGGIMFIVGFILLMVVGAPDAGSAP